MPPPPRILADVEDQGGGLTAGAAETIFHQFMQADAERSGLSLGLAISRGVEANRGTFGVRDLPGTGCILTIDLSRRSALQFAG